MPFTVINNPAVGDTLEVDSFGIPVIDDLNFLNDEIGSIVSGTATVKNGSFENGSGVDTAPTSWDLSITSGNSTAFETSAANTRHGKQAFSMTTPGSVSGGVTLISTDFIIIAEEYDFKMRWLLKCSVANTKVTVNVKFFTGAESLISTFEMYDEDTTNPTDWTELSNKAIPPATAKLAKVEIIAVNNSNAATCFFDGFEIKATEGAQFTTFTSTGTFKIPYWVTTIKARIWAGAGGGGGGGGQFSGNAGSAGGVSWVDTSSELARGGAGGGAGGGFGGGGGAGGAGFSGVFSISDPRGLQNGVTTGTSGEAGSGTVGGVGGAGSANNWNVSGGAGGAGNVNPGGGGSAGGAGSANTANGGGGGGGASDGASNISGGGGGGTDGEYAEWNITVTPSETITVTVGAAGAGGSPGGGSLIGNAGGAGGSGLVIIEY